MRFLSDALRRFRSDWLRVLLSGPNGPQALAFLSSWSVKLDPTGLTLTILWTFKVPNTGFAGFARGPESTEMWLVLAPPSNNDDQSQLASVTECCVQRDVTGINPLQSVQNDCIGSFSLCTVHSRPTLDFYFCERRQSTNARAWIHANQLWSSTPRILPRDGLKTGQNRPSQKYR